MTQTLSNALFISDLHLMEDRPDCIRAFFQFLQWIPDSTEALFILGDFFEYWVGDDIQLPYSDEISTALRTARDQKNIAIYFIAGNRDFAVGQEYCHKSGMSLLMDQSVFNIAGHRVLLAHGDIFCTDDKQYQRFRKVIRHRWVMKLLLSLRANIRIGIAQKLRAKSKARFQRDPYMIDVVEASVTDAIQKSGASIIVHGHTHLADIHLAPSNHQKTYQRMVLGDWHNVGWYGRISHNGPELFQFSIESPVFSF